MVKLKFMTTASLGLAIGFAVSSANAQSMNLSTGTAVMADGYDTSGNLVKLYDGPGRYQNNTPAGETSLHGGRNAITDVIGNGYADMNRQTRNVEEADKTYVQPDYLNGRYQGVIDFGVTRDANWTTVYTIADLSTSNPYGPAPGVSSNDNWGSEERQQSIANFLKEFSSANGYIDNYVITPAGSSGAGTGANVRASTAELYGNAAFNAEGGMFDQTRARGYQAGTNYREGGLSNIDKGGGGVIGQSGGYYFDEGGQYTLDAQGNITFNNGPRTATYGDSKNPSYNTSGTNNAAAVAYDDWNQHGLVCTGLDLIAYTTNFNTSLGYDTIISGTFNVLGHFLDVYINGNKIDKDLL